MNKTIISMATVSILSIAAMAGGDVVAPIVEEVSPVEAVADNSGMYVGVAYGFVRTTEDHVGGVLPTNVFYIDTIDSDSVMFQAGYKFNEYVAVEGRYWAGFSKTGQDSVRGIDIDMTSDTWALYVKPMYPVTETLDVYALLGYASSTYEYTNPNYNLVSLFEPDGFSWGLGVSYDMTDTLAVFVDYVNMIDETNTALGADFENKTYSINVGVNYRF